MSLNRAKQDLDTVEAEIAAIKRQLDEGRELLSNAERRADKLRATIEVLTAYETPQLVSAGSKTQPSADSSLSVEATNTKYLDPSSPFYGKSLGAAAALILAREKEPLTAAYMVKVLREAGWNFTSTNPPLVLYWALRSHASKTGEIVTVPGSKWALTASRPKADHVARSLAGLAAARARGVVLGPPRRMTDESLTQMRKMFDEGATIAKVARALGVSEVTIKRYRARDKQAKDDTSDESSELGANVHRLAR